MPTPPTEPSPTAPGESPQRTLQHSAVGPPNTSDDRGAPGAWVGSRKSSRDDVSLSSLRESGIGLARPAAPPAPPSRASLLDAMRGLGSLRREDALPPDATAVQGVQVSRSRPAYEIIAVLRIKAQRIWPVRATD